MAGYITGWTYCFEILIVAIADVTAFGIYMGLWFPDVAHWVWVLSVVLIIGAVNMMSVKVFGELEFWFSFFKVATIIIIVAADPGRAFVTLVDAAPALVSAEWAVAVSSETGELVHRSWQAPHSLDEAGGLTGVKAADLRSLRPCALSAGRHRFMSLPVPGTSLHLILARTEGPSFHRAELDRAIRVVEIVAILGR